VTVIALAVTWSKVWGGEVGALAPKKVFCHPLQNVKFWGDGGGLTVCEFQYLTYGFRIYVVDFNI